MIKLIGNLDNVKIRVPSSVSYRDYSVELTRFTRAMIMRSVCVNACKVENIVSLIM